MARSTQRPARGPARGGAPLDWSPETAEATARSAGIAQLGDRHWRVIASLREEAARRGRIPGLGRLEELTGFDDGQLRDLFPGDTEALIARIAGLPAPPSGDARAAKGAGGSMKPDLNHRGRLLGVTLTLLLAAPASATNGMYLAGYGSEAAGRAGTNVAIADRALGLQSNPAGIAQLQGQHLGLDVQLLAPRLSYAGDPFGNTMDGKRSVFTMPSVSYARGNRASRWTWGVGLVSQGGMGATFEGYRTPFGTTDGTYSEVRFATLTPALAYSVSSDLAVGVSVNAGYSDVAFRFWPNTSYYSDGGTPSDPSDDIGFFGANLSRRARAFNTSARAGVLWTALPALQLGAVFQTKTTGDYRDGTLSLDMSALGLGDVSYDATVDGFTWPAQVGLGVQVRPAERWVVAADARRLMWSDAVRKIEVKGTSPDGPSPLAEVTLPFVFDWDDQWVASAGGEFRVSPALTLRGGYNFGSSPVPDATLNPLFPATIERHATLGLGYTVGGNTFNLAVERAFQHSQTNSNTDPSVNPFGPGAGVEHDQWTVSIGFSNAFSR